MRSDMGRVVIERPRRGSSNPSLKARKVGELRLDSSSWEDWEYNGPQKVPNSGVRGRAGGRMQSWDPSIGDKSFTDVLGPLYGYLKKSIGRPWDDVYSELSAGLGCFSWPLRHILTMHVDVETNTYLGVDGKIYAENGHGNTCVSDYSYRSHEFYVHPLTRRLTAAPVRRRHSGWRWKPELTQWQTDRVQDGDHWFVKIEGLWYIGRYRARVVDDVMTLGPRSQEWPHSDRETFVKIKQANGKELRRMRSLRRA